MTGFTIMVTTNRLGDASSSLGLFFVAEPDAVKALEILFRQQGLIDEVAEIVGPLSDAEIEGLGLSPGECRSAP